MISLDNPQWLDVAKDGGVLLVLAVFWQLLVRPELERLHAALRDGFAKVDDSLRGLRAEGATPRSARRGAMVPVPAASGVAGMDVAPLPKARRRSSRMASDAAAGTTEAP